MRHLLSDLSYPVLSCLAALPSGPREVRLGTANLIGCKGDKMRRAGGAGSGQSQAHRVQSGGGGRGKGGSEGDIPITDRLTNRRIDGVRNGSLLTDTLR